MTPREPGTQCPCDRGRKWNKQCLYELCKECCDSAGNLPFPCTAPSHKSGSLSKVSSPTGTTIPPPQSPPNPPISAPHLSHPPTSTPHLTQWPASPATPLFPTTQKPRGQRYPLWEADELKRRNSVEVVESNRRQRQILEVEMRSVKTVHFFHTVCLDWSLWIMVRFSCISGWCTATRPQCAASPVTDVQGGYGARHCCPFSTRSRLSC